MQVVGSDDLFFWGCQLWFTTRPRNGDRWTWDLCGCYVFVVWHLRLKFTLLVVYIDNEGAKFSLIKEYSSALAVTAICAFTAPFLDTRYILRWYSRVSSASDLAGYPSRKVNRPFWKNRWVFMEGKPLKPSEAVWKSIVRRKRHMKHGWGPWRKRAAWNSPSISKEKRQ